MIANSARNDPAFTYNARLSRAAGKYKANEIAVIDETKNPRKESGGEKGISNGFGAFKSSIPLDILDKNELASQHFPDLYVSPKTLLRPDSVETLEGIIC